MPRPKHSVWWYVKIFFISLQLVVFCGIVISMAILRGIYDQLSRTVLPNTDFITERNKADKTVIYAADGKTVLAEFRGERRKYVPLEEMKGTSTWKGKTVKVNRLADATLSIEDARFYTHPGMDAKRIAKAAWVNLTSGDSTSQGGSTITEQLAVNLYLTRTKSISRRLQTALLALQLEKRFTKDEILEMYLNEIYYGNKAYGCEAAAQTYFNKSAKNLTVAEAALMAGLPQQPARLDPFDHFDRSKARQRLVLSAMVRNNKITYAQYQQAVNDNSVQQEIEASRRRMVTTSQSKQHWRAPYFVAYVRQYLRKEYHYSDDYLNKAGLKIYTTLDPTLQSYAEKAMRDRLNELGGRKLQGAMVCIDPWTGRVLAMYGGRDYYDKTLNGEFNRATLAKRQPGSTFKPYVYAAAMEAGLTPDTTEVDARLMVNRNTREIRNYDRIHRGKMTLRQAIGMSNNVVATKTLLRLAPDPDSAAQVVIQKAHLMGIESNLPAVPTLALGTGEVTLLEHVSAFGVFATRGLRAEETPIDKVVNSNGETVIELETPVRGARVLSETAGSEMWDMLRYVVTNGTGRPAQIPGADVIGKTGTTSSNKDVWFMGATKQLACGVWIGYDQPKNLGDSSAGSKWCAPAWRNFMVPALDTWRQRNPIEKMIEDARTTERQRLTAAQRNAVQALQIKNQIAARAGRPTEGATPSGSAPARSNASDDNGDGARPGDLGYHDSSPDGDRDPDADSAINPPPPDNSGSDGADNTGDQILGQPASGSDAAVPPRPRRNDNSEAALVPDSSQDGNAPIRNQ